MLDRFAAARACGFDAVEFAFPYDYDVADLRARLRDHRLRQVLFNLPAGDFAAGERGIAVDPTRVDEFRKGVAAAVALAPQLDCTQVNCLAGKRVAGVDDATMRATIVANLRFAAEALARAGVTLLVEPLNRVDTPEFFLGTTSEACAVIDDVGAANVKLQYDVYHAQRGEGNVIATLRDLLPRIGHVQIADAPGRHEPGTGELAYDRILRELDPLDYDGWVGLEYVPSRTTAETFGWLESYGFARASGVP
jgi:hydroxypyruvate isomerase